MNLIIFHEGYDYHLAAMQIAFILCACLTYLEPADPVLYRGTIFAKYRAQYRGTRGIAACCEEQYCTAEPRSGVIRLVLTSTFQICVQMVKIKMFDLLAKQTKVDLRL